MFSNSIGGKRYGLFYSMMYLSKIVRIGKMSTRR